ncbi:protein FAR-RED ELONGATED HYPOCOTYL 3-like isoform X2 [Glycine soja]|uniref:Protein FAR1-RELATED SEQUENCE 5 isoform A n=1 Tax=Glycine soja TaxID=3848 RepID=A0A445GNE1_GLYSO|nr:protein FAR-RED ELONGATED HYPOCOTYL 3-like isoform X2 [Glycine soja]RZB62781.1 Protein FAR1-RELATED SEQUENCE 5 isoform A [Glycine soja]
MNLLLLSLHGTQKHKKFIFTITVASYDYRIRVSLNSQYFVAAVEFGIDASINGETVGNATIVQINSSTADGNKVGCSSFNPAYKQGHDDNITQDSSGGDTIPSGIPAVSVASVDEPYVGQEFESEAAAHAFYNAYAKRVGFIIRVSKLSRSRRDGTAIGRALVCNREGYRMPDKREKIVRQRAETRVGCRAMILVRKVSSGKWVITKFIMEHTHPLTPGKGRRDCIYEQYPNEHDKIRELSQQLAIERKRSATYKRHLELIFEQIEEHNDSLSKKIQHIVDSVKEMETKEQNQR